MASITIRRIPQDWLDELEARAASKSQSLQEYMLDLVAFIVANPPLDLVIERAQADQHQEYRH